VIYDDFLLGGDMFYHINISITGVTDWFELNKTEDQILREFVCPYINKETTIHNDQLFNMSSLGSLSVYQTDNPIDSDWPLKKSDYMKKDWGSTSETEGAINLVLDWYKYETALKAYLNGNEYDVTVDLYKKGLILIETGEYKAIRNSFIESLKGNNVFFICPMENPDVNHNYNFVIKPIIEKYQFSICRADELSHSGTITEAVLKAIDQSRFIVADMTDERPNCYYELGYAHARSKPVIILAKTSTPRHFDISTYKWNYWNTYEDLKPIFERELKTILEILESQIS
jgi:hypothetical protein